MDLPDDDWEDEAFIDEAFIDETYRLSEGSQPGTAAGSTAPTVKTGGMNLRCVCWLMNLIILAVLCAAGSYSLKQPEASKFVLWLSLNVLGKSQTPLLSVPPTVHWLQDLAMFRASPSDGLGSFLGV